MHTRSYVNNTYIRKTPKVGTAGAADRPKGFSKEFRSKNRYRKHQWVPFRVCENKYVEAYCILCGAHECAKADFCDSENISAFWRHIEKKRDCKGKR